MKLIDIIEKSINKEWAYNDALEELKKLGLPYDDHEKYEILLHKLLGNKDLTRMPQYFYTGLPNSLYLEVLEVSIGLVRDGLYSPEIAQHLYNTYFLSAALITYFINEATSIVRMNTLLPEELASIGEAYHVIASKMEQKGLRTKPQIKADEINAEEISNIEMEEVDEEDY